MNCSCINCCNAMIGCTNQRRVFDKFIQIGHCLNQLNLQLQQLQESMHYYPVNAPFQQQGFPMFRHTPNVGNLPYHHQLFQYPQPPTYITNNYYSNGDVSFEECSSDDSSEHSSDDSSEDHSFEDVMNLSRQEN